MFCDLADSTPLAGRLDPESYRDLVHEFRAVAEESITRYGGRVAQYLGDGVLASFGYPVAHDDDPRRAVIAGLAVVRRVVDIGNPDLAARVAIHTGPVIVGDTDDAAVGRDAMFGLAPNIASRLQALTERNSVIISGATAALVQGYFELDFLGSFSLKGVPRPVEAFRPTASLEQITRFDVAVQRGLTPFLGRDDDLAWLGAHWHAARGGRSGIALLLGDPGSGKTRLVHEFERSVDHEHDVLALRSSALQANHPLHPVLQHLRRDLGLLGQAPQPGATARLQAVVDRCGLAEPATALIGALLNLPVDAHALPEGVEMRRRMALTALRALLLAGPRDRPLLVLLEDAHWADPTTLELVGSLATAPPRPVLVVCTARSELATPWRADEHVTVRVLERLPERWVRRMVTVLADGVTIPDGDIDAVVARSDGIPLFIEEVTAIVAARARRAEGPSDDIPATILDLLVGRVDRLGARRALLQSAAVIGREFDVDLLACVHGSDRVTVERALGDLDVADLLVVEPDRRHYAFRHVLIRDAAYSTILLRRRATLHGRVARKLIGAGPSGVALEPVTADVIAYHCREAGMTIEAIDHYHQAAMSSMATGANEEAVRYLDEAAALVTDLPDERERSLSELRILVARGPALMAQRGYGHPDVATAFRRARQLCDLLAEPLALFPVLYGLVAYSAVRSDLASAADIAAQLRRAAEHSGDPGLLMLAHAASAQTYFMTGDFARAADHARTCRAHHDPPSQSDHRILFGEDPGTVCAAVEACLEWLLGRPARAVALMESALSAARLLGHRFTLVQMLVMAARLHHYLGDVDALRTAINEARDLSEHHGFPLFVAETKVWTGWADAVVDGRRTGTSLLVSGLDAYRASGARVFVPHHLVLLGEALWQTGDMPGALAVLTRSTKQAEASGNLDHQVEALRLSAVVTAGAGGAGVEALLTAAEDLARRQRARSLSVRVARTRLQLAAEHGDRAAVDRARAELAAACAALPPEADTSGLRDARRLGN